MKLLVIFLFLIILCIVVGKKQLRTCKTSRTECGRAGTGKPRICKCPKGKWCLKTKGRSQKFKCQQKKTKKTTSVPEPDKCVISKSKDMQQLSDKVQKSLENQQRLKALKRFVMDACACTQSRFKATKRCKNVQSKHCTNYIKNNFRCYLAKSKARRCSLDTNIAKLNDHGVFKRIQICENRKKNCQGMPCVVDGLFSKCIGKNFRQKDCIIQKLTKRDIIGVGNQKEIISAISYYVDEIHRAIGGVVKYGEYTDGEIKEKCQDADWSKMDYEYNYHWIDFHFVNKLNVTVSLIYHANTYVEKGVFSFNRIEIAPNTRTDVLFKERHDCYHTDWYDEPKTFLYRSLMFSTNIYGYSKCAMIVQYTTWYILNQDKAQSIWPAGGNRHTICTIDNVQFPIYECGIEVRSTVDSGCTPSITDKLPTHKTVVTVNFKWTNRHNYYDAEWLLPPPTSSSSSSSSSSEEEDKWLHQYIELRNMDKSIGIGVLHIDKKYGFKGGDRKWTEIIAPQQKMIMAQYQTDYSSDYPFLLFHVYEPRGGSYDDRSWVRIYIGPKVTKVGGERRRTCRASSALADYRHDNTDHRYLRVNAIVFACRLLLGKTPILKMKLNLEISISFTLRCWTTMIRKG